MLQRYFTQNNVRNHLSVGDKNLGFSLYNMLHIHQLANDETIVETKLNECEQEELITFRSFIKKTIICTNPYDEIHNDNKQIPESVKDELNYFLDVNLLVNTKKPVFFSMFLKHAEEGDDKKEIIINMSIYKTQFKQFAQSWWQRLFRWQGNAMFNLHIFRVVFDVDDDP